ncbi:hypothetical protein RJ639_006204 [Escallonia herrerae]|uniref:Uncharacterized protein n=1 Tax=Escallonia herrerae TaxID=1293975 RepID=A0AA88VXB3_9ASTE|nr:hypothetical protein RJ639_006204 [Escallonia herrerae]
MMRNMSKRYRSTGVWQKQNQFFSYIPKLNYIYRFNFSSDENETYFTYSIVNPAIVSRFDSSISRSPIVTIGDGNRFSVYPKNKLSKNQPTFCECLQGFEPYSTENTRLNHWSDGCVRKTPLQCEYPFFKGKKGWILESFGCKVACRSNPIPCSES